MNLISTMKALIRSGAHTATLLTSNIIHQLAKITDRPIQINELSLTAQQTIDFTYKRPSEIQQEIEKALFS
jgi:hypothetical protein